MQNHSGINKFLIESGVKIGLLEVIERVVLLRQHELFYDTPRSYLMQGPVWECHCHGCGNRKLISEVELSRGKLRSCGCLRQRLWQEARERQLEKAKRAQFRSRVNAEIKLEKFKLATLKLQLPTNHRDQQIDECAARLRNLYSQKGGLTSRNSKRKVIDPIALAELHKTERDIYEVQEKLYAVIRNDELRLEKEMYKSQLAELKKKLRNLAKGKII